jgi:2-hydroxychromene-2-carboxylate isomerase
MTSTVRFYFDPISPYAWLAGRQVDRIDAAGLALDFRPVLLAGVLGAHGSKGPAEIPAKRDYTMRDAMRLAARIGAPLVGPPTHPFNPLRALRMCIALEDAGERRRFALALMDGAWAHGLDLTDPAVLARLAGECGLDGPGVSSRADDPAVKSRLVAETEAAIAAGVFGVPTFVFDNEVFWGADRIDVLLWRAAGNRIDEVHLRTMLARPASASRRV